MYYCTASYILLCEINTNFECETLPVSRWCSVIPKYACEKGTNFRTTNNTIENNLNVFRSTHNFSIRDCYKLEMNWFFPDL